MGGKADGFIVNENNMNEDFYVNEEEESIDIQALLLELWHRAWIIAVSAFLAAFLGFFCSVFFVTPMYRASTSVYVLASEEVNQAALNTGLQLTNDYARIIKSRSVCEIVAANLGLDVRPSALSSAISVSTEDNTRVITISAVSSDPVMAQSIANEVRVVASDFLINVMDLPGINTVDEADIPIAPFTPNTKRNAVLGLVLGFLLSTIVISVRFLLDDTIKTEDDVKKKLGLSVLGMVPVRAADAEENNKKSSFRKYADRAAYSVKRRMRRRR